MIASSPVSLGSLFLAALLVSGCSRTIVKPLQVNPESDPQIVIFHEVTYRAAPVVYVCTIHAAALNRWKTISKGQRTTLRAGDDFSLSLGRLIQGAVYIAPDARLDFNGTLEVSTDGVVINLDIRPSAGATTHPIDGKYRLTKANTIVVHPPE